jgi:iron complex outermembrane recepter protein
MRGSNPVSAGRANKNEDTGMARSCWQGGWKDETSVRWAGMSLVAGMALLVGLPAPALAQSQTVEEITVTSRKRSERLQDVPDTISAFSATQIEDRGIASIADFARFVPNVDFRTPQQPGTAFITIRGIGMERFQDPSVAILIDGVQLTSSYQLAQGMFDLERIEVLKGPQGALYGRNAIGGAINITTKQPGDRIQGQAAIGWAEGNDRILQASLSGPLVEQKVKFALAGTWEKSDGLLENEFRQHKVDFDTRSTFRGKLLLTPFDDLSIDLRAGTEFGRPGSAYYIPMTPGQANNTSLPIVTSTLGTSRRILRDFSVKADWTNRLGTLTSITSYLTTNDFLFEDLDYLPAPYPTPAAFNRPAAMLALPFGPGGQLIPVAADAGQRVFVRSWSEELRFSSPSAQRLRYQVGGFVSTIKQATTTTGYFYLFGPTNPLTADLSSNVKQDFVYALFGQANYDLTPELELTLAARYDRQDKKQTGVIESIQRDARFQSFQPKASLAYKLNPDAMVYATVAKGFRGGGFNNSDLITRIYGAETVINYELGAKTTLLDRHLTFNPSVFYQQFDNRQTYTFDIASASQVLFSIPRSNLWGAELQGSWVPANGWQVDFGLGYLDSEITEYNPKVKTLGIVKNGNRLALIPRWTGNLGLQYATTLPTGINLIARADFSHKSGLVWGLDNVDEQNAVNLVDLRLIAEFQNGVSLTLYGRNLFDEKYSEEIFLGKFAGLNNAIGGVYDARYPSRPRQLGVQVKWKF